MKITIGFSDSAGFNIFGWGIKKYMGTPYYHTYFYIPDTNEVFESTTKGVTKKTREEWLRTHKVIYEYELELTDSRVLEIRNFGLGRLGTPYGFWQYITIFLKLAKDNGLRYTICSEFVARAFIVELKKFTDDNTLDTVTPKEVYEEVERLYSDCAVPVQTYFWR